MWINMEFQSVINKRKMIRSFTTDAIQDDAINRIIQNFFKGPSAGFAQGFELLVLKEPNDIQRYFKCLGTSEERKEVYAGKWSRIENAQLILIPLSHKQTYLDRYAEPDKDRKDKSVSHWPVPFWLTDTAMAAMNALLTVVDLNLGASFEALFKETEIKAEFKITEEYKPLGAILIGYPELDDPPEPSVKRGKRKKAEIVHFGDFG